MYELQNRLASGFPFPLQRPED